MPSTNNQCLCVPQLTTLESGENYKEKIKVEAHKKGGDTHTVTHKSVVSPPNRCFQNTNNKGYLSLMKALLGNGHTHTHRANCFCYIITTANTSCLPWDRYCFPKRIKFLLIVYILANEERRVLLFFNHKS